LVTQPAELLAYGTTQMLELVLDVRVENIRPDFDEQSYRGDSCIKLSLPVVAHWIPRFTTTGCFIFAW